MWTKSNLRRNLLDMHISDDMDEYLSKLSIDKYADSLVAANIQCAIIMTKSHTGLCYWPSSIGEMHKGLKSLDFFGSMTQACHERGIQVVAYYSQIYDNWAYNNYPSWRLVTPEGKGFMECDQNNRMHQTGRYGIVCPNNPEYREYVKKNLEELNKLYRFEGMFLDMAFWPEICYCANCRTRYLEQTGQEIPRVIDWNSPNWREFVQTRYEWMREFAMYSTDIVKRIHPEVTVEHNFSMVMSDWRHASTEELADTMDFCSGDFYGGYLQQSFICKYFSNISSTLPFNYHTSRCSPNLEYHTTTKSSSELIRNAIIAFMHNGAFMTVDALNPDGSFQTSVYASLYKKVYSRTIPFEQYFGGDIMSDIAIWFNTKTRFSHDENGLSVDKAGYVIDSNKVSAVNMASVLAKHNIPYTVIGTRNLNTLKQKVLIIPSVPEITDAEMDCIEKFVNNGGSLYISGPIGNLRLQKMLGVIEKGRTKHEFTYLQLTRAADMLLADIDTSSPYTVPMRQYIVELIENNIEVLATLVLPYTEPGSHQFSAIHSNPPGKYTNQPAVLLKRAGKGKILWIGACLENSKQYQNKNLIRQMMDFLVDGYRFYTNAPMEVEVIETFKDGVHYFCVINQQENENTSTIYNIYIDLPNTACSSAKLLPEGTLLDIEDLGIKSRIALPPLDDFLLISILA